MNEKTQAEIDDLKRQWEHDPIWDIEATEGFEAHREELEVYADAKRAEWKAAWLKENAFTKYIGKPDPTLDSEDAERVAASIGCGEDDIHRSGFADNMFEIYFAGRDDGNVASQALAAKLRQAHPELVVDYAGEWQEYGSWYHGVRFYRPLTEVQLTRGATFRMEKLSHATGAHGATRQAVFEQRISRLKAQGWRVVSVHHDTARCVVTLERGDV